MIPFHLRLLAFPLRLFFHLLYHQMAWSYDGIAALVSLGMWKDWVLSVIPDVEGWRILELGHGPGHLQVALRKDKNRPLQVYGLDRSPQMSRQACARLKRNGLTPDLVNGAAQALPFPNQAFHTVVATFPSEYIFHPETLSEVRRVLAPGGIFIALPLAWITGHRLLERLAAWLFRVTGEAPLFHDSALEPVRKLGFDTHVEYRALKSSVLLIIKARKTD